MDKLITNLDTNLGPVLREQLDTNFKKIQNGVDGQADSLNKQIEKMLGDVPLQDQNEVTQARIDVNGKLYDTLKGREDATQAIAETALSEERATLVEVQDARINSNGLTYPTLKERMDNQENDLNNSINNKLAQISVVPETFTNLAALQSKYPTGKTGIFVTVDNGHKYIWSNNTWTDAGVYQSAGISDADADLVHSKIKDRFSLINFASGFPNTSNSSVSKVLDDMGLTWFDVKGTDSTSQYTGIKWIVDKSKLNALLAAANSNKMIVDFLIKSSSQIALQIQMSYYDNSGNVVGSQNMSQITVESARTNHINKLISLNSYPNATKIEFIIMSAPAVSADFEFKVTDVSVVPEVDAPSDNQQDLLNNFNAISNTDYTPANYSHDYLMRKIVTVDSASNSPYKGILWPISNLAYLRMINDGMQSMLIRGSLKTSLDAPVCLFINYVSDSGKILRSYAAKSYFLSANVETCIDGKVFFPSVPNTDHITVSVACLSGSLPHISISAIDFKLIPSKEYVEPLSFSEISVQDFTPNGNIELTTEKDSAGKIWADIKGLDTTSRYSGTKIQISYEKWKAIVNSEIKSLDFKFIIKPINVDGPLVVQTNLYKADGTLLSTTRRKTMTFTNQNPQLIEVQIPIQQASDKFEFIIMSLPAVSAGFEFKVTDVSVVPIYVADAKTNQQDSLPVINIVGDISNMSHDVSSILSYTSSGKINLGSGYLTAKWQGDSSIGYPKKNLSIKLFSDQAAKNKRKLVPFNGWLKDNSFVLKANWIDATQARNIVNAKLFSEIVANRKGLSSDWIGMDNFSQIKGVPVHVFINSVDQGVFTFNTKKNKSLFNMDDDVLSNIAVSGETWGDATAFRQSTAKLDGTDFNMEQPSANPTADNIAKFSRLMKFVNESSDADYRANESQYVDVPSFIDYLIFVSFILDSDGTGKNVIYATWDGNIWSALPYDLDSTWGLQYDGASLQDLSRNMFDLFKTRNKLFTQIMKFHKSDILARYAELRSSVLSASHIIDCFESFMSQIDENQLENDQLIWPNIPSIELTNFDQIRKAVYTRTQIVDQQIQGI